MNDTMNEWSGMLSNPVELHDDLKPYLEEGDSFPMLRHPLYFAVPYYESMNRDYNESYRVKLEHAKQCLKDSNIGGYIAIYEKPYRLDAFLTYVMYRPVSDREYWSNLADIWMGSENIHQNEKAWRKLFTSNQQNHQFMMEEHERADLNAMPEEFTVYRGNKDTKTDSRFSWTTNKVTAEWFRDRFVRGEGELLVGTVKRDDVIAYKTGRKESEIIVLPEHVTDLVETK